MKDELLKNLEEKNDCINEYFGKIDRTSNTIEALGAVLTNYIASYKKSLDMDYNQMVLTSIIELNSFIVQLQALTTKEDEILFFQEDPVSGALKMNN